MLVQGWRCFMIMHGTGVRIKINVSRVGGIKLMKSNIEVNKSKIYAEKQGKIPAQIFLESFSLNL